MWNRGRQVHGLGQRQLSRRAALVAAHLPRAGFGSLAAAYWRLEETSGTTRPTRLARIQGRTTTCCSTNRARSPPTPTPRPPSPARRATCACPVALARHNLGGDGQALGQAAHDRRLPGAGRQAGNGQSRSSRTTPSGSRPRTGTPPTSGTAPLSGRADAGRSPTRTGTRVATSNGSRARIYLDGVLKQDIPGTLQMTANTQPLNLGGANNGAYFFNGWLDEVAIYPTALPRRTILAHYQQRDRTLRRKPDTTPVWSSRLQACSCRDSPSTRTARFDSLTGRTARSRRFTFPTSDPALRERSGKTLRLRTRARAGRARRCHRRLRPPPTKSSAGQPSVLPPRCPHWGGSLLRPRVRSPVSGELSQMWTKSGSTGLILSG